MRRLARDVNLHDGIIEKVTWDPAIKQLALDLVTWGPQPRQWKSQTVRMTFGGVLLGARRISALRDAARDRESCILYWEVDIDDRGWTQDPIYTLRLLLWPGEELSIDFAEMTLDVQDRTDHQFTCSEMSHDGNEHD